MLLAREKFDREMDEEMRLHLQMRARESRDGAGQDTPISDADTHARVREREVAAVAGRFALRNS